MCAHCCTSCPMGALCLTSRILGMRVFGCLFKLLGVGGPSPGCHQSWSTSWRCTNTCRTLVSHPPSTQHEVPMREPAPEQTSFHSCLQAMLREASPVQSLPLSTQQFKSSESAKTIVEPTRLLCTKNFTCKKKNNFNQFPGGLCFAALVL